MVIIHLPEYSFFLEKNTQENIDIYEQNRAKLSGACIDGHFWVEKDDKIIDYTLTTVPQNKRFNICGAVIYYKPAPEITQKLAIDYMYKRNESFYNVKRDTEMFKELINIRDYKYGMCVYNVLKLLNENGGKIVFGSVGFKYPNGTNTPTSFTYYPLPKNAVYWIFGFGKFKIFKDFLQKHGAKVDEFITIEN